MTRSTPTHTHPGGDRHLTHLETVALAYLLLPVLLEFMGWLRWQYALPCIIFCLCAFWLCFRQPQKNKNDLPNWGFWIPVGLICLVWVSWSGLLPGFALNLDWRVRMSVLHDLTVSEWPVAYKSPHEAGEMIWLRLPMAYYLVSAALGDFLGGTEFISRTILLLWTALGATLFLALCATWSSFKTTITCVVVVIFFSGMDIAGVLTQTLELPPPGEHIEWWASFFQYSSNTTLMFWVPNHALPGWLSAAIVWRHRTSGLAPLPALLLLLCCTAWAPLVAIGLLPFLLAVTLHGQSIKNWLRECFHPATISLIAPAIIMAKLLTFGISSDPNVSTGDGLKFNHELLGGSAVTLILFTLLEWGLLCWVILKTTEKIWPIQIAACILLILPWFHFGPGNDLVMRGGIPAITIIMLGCLNFLQSTTVMKSRVGVSVILFLAIGSVTPLQEFYRGATARQFSFSSNGLNFVERHNTPWHYTAQLAPGDWLSHLLRTPAVMPNATAAPR